MAEAELQLSNGRIAIIDAEDLAKVIRWRWHARYCKPLYYAARTTSTYPNHVRKVVSIYLHSFLKNPPKGMQVHHVNGDTLDDRKRNLEIVTPAENLRRRRL